jgi:hypothetical protein
VNSLLFLNQIFQEKIKNKEKLNLLFDQRNFSAIQISLKYVKFQNHWTI